MNSEKAKEIKKWLYERSDAKLLDNSYNLVGITYGDILALITELESENKRLNKAINNIQKGFDSGEFISKDCKVMALKRFAEVFKQECIDAGIFPAFVARKLEETLQEFIGNE